MRPVSFVEKVWYSGRVISVIDALAILYYRFISRPKGHRTYRVKVRSIGSFLFFCNLAEEVFKPGKNHTVLQRRLGLYEPYTSRTLREVIQPGDVVIELGAAYGDFTVQLARLVGENGMVHSFEPNQRYFHTYLVKNISLNGCEKQVKAYDKGLAEKSQTLIDADGKEFQTESLADFLSHMGKKPTFIFIDTDAKMTDGSEVKQEHGILRTICAYAKAQHAYPTIFLEYKGDKSGIVAMVKEAGYHTITPITRRHILFQA